MVKGRWALASFKAKEGCDKSCWSCCLKIILSKHLSFEEACHCTVILVCNLFPSRARAPHVWERSTYGAELYGVCICVWERERMRVVKIELVLRCEQAESVFHCLSDECQSLCPPQCSDWCNLHCHNIRPVAGWQGREGEQGTVMTDLSALIILCVMQLGKRREPVAIEEDLSENFLGWWSCVLTVICPNRMYSWINIK